MAASIARLPATVAGLATRCPFSAISANGWHDSSAVPNTRADPMWWRWVFTLPQGSCMKQDWNSVLSAAAATDAAPFRATSGATAFAEIMDSGYGAAPDSRDAPSNVRQPAHGAIGNPDRPIPISRRQYS